MLSIDYYNHFKNSGKYIGASDKKISSPAVGRKGSVQVQIVIELTSDPNLIKIDSSRNESFLISLSENYIDIV